MKKDPAFLFYSKDFITGCTFLSNEQTGIYIRLLCAQHQSGGMLPRAYFDSLTIGHDLLKEKFVETEDGYFNKRLMEEMEKRNKKCCNLSANAKHRWEKEKEKECKQNANGDANAYAKYYANSNADEMPTGDVNVREICVDVSSSAKGVTGSKLYIKECASSDVNKRIIDDLNAVCSTSYKHTTPKTCELIATRIKEGFTEQDFYTVHRNMFATWSLDTKMREFLRPITLYSNKFESYLNKVVNVELDKYSDSAKKTMQNCANFIKNMEKQNA